MTTNPGKLIVIDGIDGAGKTTQAKMLVDTLNATGQARYIHFPRYETFFGATIKRFLNGEFGDSETTSPYLCSMAYALDRQSVADELKKDLSQGVHIVTDRYVTSNLAHQAARCHNPADTEAFIAWDMQLEYDELGIVRESIVLFLDTPPAIARGLRQKRTGSPDILERDDDHQQQTYDLYQTLSRRFEHWHTIHSVEGEQMQSEQAIHEAILQTLRQSAII